MTQMKKHDLEKYKKCKSSYGGALRNTRKGRQKKRPLSSKNSMHLVLRSSKARRAWSFLRHEKKIQQIIDKFSQRHNVKIISLANVGNHLHFHLKLSRNGSYKPFIRAITSSIAMAVTGASRWKPLKEKFWDHRPFTRIVLGLKEYLNMQDYIFINQLEGFGYPRDKARYIVKKSRAG